MPLKSPRYSFKIAQNPGSTLVLLRHVKEKPDSSSVDTSHSNYDEYDD